ncbi:MAG TPA: glycosyltransferase family 4 protein [Lacipirellulaceae bacterium]|jgi:glycosyltransferase involved in cell wall biosynthesis
MPSLSVCSPESQPDGIGEPPVATIPMFPLGAAESRHDLGRSDPAPTDPVATKRVLHVINGEHYSGAERVQDLLARRLPQFGYEVGFVCMKPVRFPLARETTSAPLVEMPMKGRFDLSVVKKLTRLLLDHDYDLVHAHTPRTAIVGRLAARKAGVPFVYHVHSPAGRDSTRRLLNALNSLVEWHTARSADRIVTVSPSLRSYMIARGFPAERVVCVPNGVPCAALGVDRPAPTGTWIIGTIALFRPRKGIEVLLEALASMRSWGAPVRLRAVGGFETLAYETSVLALVDRLGLADAVDWIGFTREINAELAKMDLFVLPSLFGEGLPMVVLEAMAMGVPVVASHVEGIPEAIAHRESGFLVEPGSVNQLAAAIREFVAGELDYPALSRCGRERHHDKFSDMAMAGNLAEVYSAILAEQEAG